MTFERSRNCWDTGTSARQLSIPMSLTVARRVFAARLMGLEAMRIILIRVTCPDKRLNWMQRPEKTVFTQYQTGVRTVCYADRKT